MQSWSQETRFQALETLFFGQRLRQFYPSSTQLCTVRWKNRVLILWKTGFPLISSLFHGEMTCTFPPSCEISFVMHSRNPQLWGRLFTGRLSKRGLGQYSCANLTLRSYFSIVIQSYVHLFRDLLIFRRAREKSAFL